MHRLPSNLKYLATKKKGDRQQAELNEASRHEPAEATRVGVQLTSPMRPNSVHNSGGSKTICQPDKTFFGVPGGA